MVYYGCADALPDHVCNPCANGTDREFGRVRSAGFIRKSALADLLVDPTLAATWQPLIDAGDIIVIPETSGSFDPGDPKELKGYGDRKSSNGPREQTLNVFDPSFEGNSEFYNTLTGVTDLVPFFRTSSKVWIADATATIVAKPKVDDDLESEVVWDVTAKVISINLPSIHDATALKDTIFICS